ncbi:MAG: hypothetical protein KC417_06655, partial [Myxococcales bacterium]|nr:hypothetical protein [Myxococcales bacterium]
GVVSEALPPGDVQRQIAELADDELVHLRFHALIWRETSVPEPVFRVAIELLAASALIACSLDHRATLRALDMDVGAIVRAHRRAMEELLGGVYGPTPVELPATRAAPVLHPL